MHAQKTKSTKNLSVCCQDCSCSVIILFNNRFLPPKFRFIPTKELTAPHYLLTPHRSVRKSKSVGNLCEEDVTEQSVNADFCIQVNLRVLPWSCLLCPVVFLSYSGPQNFVDANNMVVVCPNVVTMGNCQYTECVYGHPLPHHKLHRVYLPNTGPYPTMGNSPMYMVCLCACVN